MPYIGQLNTGFTMNRLEPSSPDSQLMNRDEAIVSPLNEQVVQTDQVFSQGGIPGTKIGNIVDTGNAGVTSVGDTASSIRFWSGKSFPNRETAPFRVTKGGTVYMEDAIIDGYRIFAATVATDGPGDYLTVGAAITAGETNIFIRNGDYTGSVQTVTLPNNSTITGESRDGVLLDVQFDIQGTDHFYNDATATNNDKTVVAAAGDFNSVVSGDKVILDKQIYTVDTVTDSTHLELVETFTGVTGTYTTPIGIFIENILIQNVTFENTSNTQINGYLGNKVQVLNCKFSATRDFSNSSLGQVDVWDTVGLKVTNCVFENCWGYNLFFLNSCYWSSIESCEFIQSPIHSSITTTSCIKAQNGAYIKILNNVFGSGQNSSTGGIFGVLLTATNSVVSDNFFNYGTSGDTAVDNQSDNNIITKNIVHGAKWGILNTIGADYCVISHNIINSCTTDGIRNSGGAYCVISNNIITSPTAEGIWCMGDYCVISGNVISASSNDGILIDGSGGSADYNTVVGNVTKGSTDNGIELVRADYNIVCGNVTTNNDTGIDVASTCDKTGIIANSILSNTTTDIVNSGTNTVISNNISNMLQAETTRVARATANLPQSTQSALFTVTGKVLLSNIVGTVTTVIQAGANNTKLIANPTTGADVDLCATVDIDTDAVGTMYNITGTLSDAMVATTSGAVKAQVTPIVVDAGTIDLSCSASKTGQVKWELHYIPLTDGATITSA